MKHIAALAAALIAAALIIPSCIDDPIVSGEQAFCDIRDGKLYSDEGMVYNVVDWNSSNPVWDTLKRAFILCDVIKKNSDTECDVRLRYFEPVYFLEGEKLSECVDSLVGTDPICFYQGWIADNPERYMNIRFAYLYYDGYTSSPHSVNIVYDDLTSNADTLKFQLRHNANGDNAQSPFWSYLSLGDGFLTLPLKDYLPAGRDSVVIRLDYDWYSSIGGYYQTDTEHGSISAKISTRPDTRD